MDIPVVAKTLWETSNLHVNGKSPLYSAGFRACYRASLHKEGKPIRVLKNVFRCPECNYITRGNARGSSKSLHLTILSRIRCSCGMSENLPNVTRFRILINFLREWNKKHGAHKRIKILDNKGNITQIIELERK